MQTDKRSSFPLERLKLLPEWDKQPFGDFIKKEFLRAIQHHSEREDLVQSLFESSVASLIHLKQINSPKLITYMRESHQKSNLMIWDDKLSSYKTGQPTKTLHTMLLKILGRELTSRERAC